MEDKSDVILRSGGKVRNSKALKTDTDSIKEDFFYFWNLIKEFIVITLINV